jgi:peptidyl-prolyl cis-trans isomerase A (cyclophilin A)
MMKAKIILIVVTGLLTMGSACTKSCKGQAIEANPPGAASTPATNAKDGPEHKGQEQPMETHKERDKLSADYSLKAGEKLFADIETTAGTIKVELFWQDAPKTVENFVDLATGKKINPLTKEKIAKNFYDGTIFHRVIKGFMIQGGDPTGTGMGGPGYKFKDEFHPSLKHSKKGILSMANAGPNSNGSQFFITEGPTPHLDNRHSVFGQAADEESLTIISKIAGAQTGANDKPATDIVIKSIKIHK